MDDVTVKAAGDWTLEVLGVPFGDPNNLDSDGQYFDADTNLHQDKYPTIPAVYFHGRDPQGKPINPEYIGKATPLRTDERGAWYQVVLDKTKTFAQRVWEAAKENIARASSGSAPHLVRTHGPRISEWPVVELSVFDAGEGRQPANRYAVALPVVKASYDEAGIDLPSELHPQGAENAEDAQTQKSNNSEVKDMEPKEVSKLIEDALKADREAQAQAQEAAKSRQAEIDAEVEKRVAAIKEEAAKNRRLPDYNGVAPYATKYNDSKYDNLSAGELSAALSMMKASGVHQPAAAIKSLALKLINEKPNSDARAKDLNYIKSNMPEAMLDEKALKAAEVMATSDSGNGAEWIGTAYSSELWRSIRHAGGIVEKLPEKIIPDGYASDYIPLEDVDPTWYKVPETTATDAVSQPTVSIPASKAGTGNKQVTVAKAGARVVYSGELTEDSIVAFAPQLREQMMISGRELMEALVINGDTETGATTNINDIAGTPAATDWFLILNGFRKLALVTNTANARSAGGALSIEDYMETMRLMGTAGLNAGDPSKVMFIVDPNVHYANMSLPEVKTRDVNSAAAIENGFLKLAYGVNIFPSWQFHRGATGLKANTAGKVDIDTQGNNTTGAILCVRPDQWKFAYKRRMTMELTRIPSSDSYEIVALARFGLAYRDTEAAAISYNVGV